MKKEIVIPKEFMGVPVNEETMREVLQGSVNQPPINQPQYVNITSASNNIARKDRYVILPARKPGNYEYPDLLIAMDRTYQNKKWNECWQELGKEGAFMLNLRQYVDFLSLLESGKRVFDGNGRQIPQTRVDELYKDIIEVRNPWRAEWLDAKFEKKNTTLGLGGKLYINYHDYDARGSLVVKKSEPLDECLMTDKNPGIDINEWLVHANNQGLPPIAIAKGDLYYWHPRDGRVARFVAYSDGADLSCGGDPSDRYDWLGVRAARVKN